jgi:hypothetical protein
MSCPVPPGNEHYPITVVRDGVPVLVCAKCQQLI